MAVQPVSVSVGGAAVQIYTPAAVGTPSIFLYNNGNVPVYIGGSAVTVSSGMLLPAGQDIEFPSYPQGLWAVAAPGTLGAATTVSVNAPAGAGTVNATSTASYSAGQTLVIGSGSAAETLTISSVTNGTTLVFTTATRFAHLSTEAVALVSAPLGTSINVLAGTR
jgi:hypothetical protein